MLLVLNGEQYRCLHIVRCKRRVQYWFMGEVLTVVRIYVP